MIENRIVLVSEKNKAQESLTSFDQTNIEPNQVLVQNKYSHISAGTELACIAGLESFFTIPGTPGYTSIGSIVSVGTNIEHLKEGDWVYTFGPHAEYFKIDVTDRWHGVCVKLPEGVNPEHAAFTHMAGIAMTAIRNSEIELGDHVLITGLGTIGNLAAQLAALQGANVIATDINDNRIKLAQQCGIEKALNSLKVKLSEVVKELTENNLVNTYIDATGAAHVIENSSDLIALNGEIILLGSPRTEYQTNLTSYLQKFHLLPWNHKLKGALEFTYPTFKTEFTKHSIERNSKIILDLINADKLVIEPLYTHKITPAEIQSAYDGLRNSPEEYMGVIIDWTM